MKRLLALSTLITIFLFLSCQNDETPINTNKASYKNSSVQRSQSEIKELTVDEFEKIGVDHNTLMQKFVEDYCQNPISKKTTFLSLNYNNADKDSLGIIFEKIQSLSNEEKHNIILENLETEYAKKTLNDLRNILLTSTNYSDLTDKLFLKSNEIRLNTKGLDYNVLMTYIYISKYSAHLWFPTNEGGLGLTDCYTNSFNSQTARTRTESDVLGGAFGMVGWAITGGSALGPFGALGGMLAATVYGAVTGSI